MAYSGQAILITGVTQEGIEQQRNIEKAIAEGKLQASQRESLREQVIKQSQGDFGQRSYQTTSTLSSIAESSRQRQLVALPLTILGQPRQISSGELPLTFTGIPRKLQVDTIIPIDTSNIVGRKIRRKYKPQQNTWNT